MDKSVYFKELKNLQTYELRKFGEKQFKDYLLTGKEWINNRKRNGIVNECIVIVWQTWKNKLLARSFAIREEYINGERHSSIDEVQRQLAGNPYKLVRNMKFRMCWGWGYINSGREWRITDDFKSDFLNGYLRYGVWYYNDEEKWLNKSIHKYCGYQQLESSEKYYINLFQIIKDYEKQPKIEFLLKNGLSHLYFDKKEYKLLNFKEKGLKSFGLKYKESMKYLKLKNKLSFIRKYEDFIVKNKLNEKELSILKVFDYEHMNANIQSIRYCEEKNISVYDYRDYISFVEELGIPKSSKNLYPDDFWMSHDELERQIKPDKYKYDEKIKEIAHDLEKYNFLENNLMIRPISDQFELNMESKKLSHCVRTYGKRIAENSTSVFVIRKESEKEVPYYTLELSNKKIIQIRGLSNCSATEDVKEFVQHWSNKYNFVYNV